MNKVFNFINYHKKILLLLIIILLLLRIVFAIYKFEFKYKTQDSYSKMKVSVISKEKNNEDKVVYLVKYNLDNFLINIYINNENQDLDFKYGDILKVNGKIIIPEKLGNPYEFDYKRYLNSNNICGTISTSSVKKVYNSNKNIVLNYKEKLEEKIEKSLPEKEGGLLKSMLYSNKLDLDYELKSNITGSGISYILNVSSANIICIINIVYILRKVFSKRKVKILQIIIIIFLFFLSGFRTSTLRAEIFLVIDLIVPNNFKISKIKKLIISLIIILFFNPYCILSLTTVFSYLSILSVIFLYNELKAKLYFILKFRKIIKKKILYKFLTIIFNSIILTLSITIFVLPFQIIAYNSINFVIFFSNILIIPIIFYIRLVGYISMFLIYFFDISNILFSSCLIPLRIIIYIVDKVNNLNLKFYIATPSLISIIFYYLIICFYILIENVIKKLVLSKKGIRLFLNRLIKIFSIIFVIYIICEQIYINNFQNYIYFFNVKQGNMCIIRKDRKTVVVDMGSTTKNLASNILKKFLQAKNIKSIDLVLLTHIHEDHVNGINKNLLDDIHIKHVAIGKIWHTINDEYNELNLLLKERNLELKQINKGDFLEVGKIKIECISPIKSFKIQSNDEINSNSGVYLINIDNLKILFMGDATKEAEKLILEDNTLILEDVDVLQVGHHGSNTSTCEDFLKKVNPKISIISSYKKVYNHPSKETIELLNKYNFKYFITEKDKAIKINI